MLFVRYTRGGEPGWGVAEGDDVYPLSRLPAGPPSYDDMANPTYRDSVRRAVESGGLRAIEGDEVSLLAPDPRPGKIVCVGLNYRGHAEEQETDLPERPLLFSKAPTCVTNPGDPIVYPAESDEVDYEVELAAVVGRTARNVTREEAPDHVAGYTVLNDVSARDAQFADGQFFRGKSFDTFAPMGPGILADDGFDPNDAAISLRVNGETRQDASTDEFVFDVFDVIEYVTRGMTLHPGDVLATGTPAGVGVFMEPPGLLEPGDTVEAHVEGIGTLANSVVPDPAAD